MAVGPDEVALPPRTEMAKILEFALDEDLLKGKTIIHTYTDEAYSEADEKYLKALYTSKKVGWGHLDIKQHKGGKHAKYKYTFTFHLRDPKWL